MGSGNPDQGLFCIYFGCAILDSNLVTGVSLGAPSGIARLQTLKGTQHPFLAQEHHRCCLPRRPAAGPERSLSLSFGPPPVMKTAASCRCESFRRKDEAPTPGDTPGHAQRDPDRSGLRPLTGPRNDNWGHCRGRNDDLRGDSHRRQRHKAYIRRARAAASWKALKASRGSTTSPMACTSTPAPDKAFANAVSDFTPVARTTQSAFR